MPKDNRYIDFNRSRCDPIKVDPEHIRLMIETLQAFRGKKVIIRTQRTIDSRPFFHYCVLEYNNDFFAYIRPLKFMSAVRTIKIADITDVKPYIDRRKR